MTRTERATDGPGDGSVFALGLVLRRAHARAAAAYLDALRPLDLEFRHLAVLIALHAHGPMSQRALVTAVGSDKATMVRVVDDLERAGLAERAAWPGDRRVHSITITEAGVAVFDVAHERAEPVLARFAAHFGPGELSALLDLLTRFAFPGEA